MVRIFRKGHSWAIVDDTAKKQYIMPTLRLAMDMAYELIGWPAQFSEGEVAPCLVFGDPEVIQRRLAEDGGLFAMGSSYTRSETPWQDIDEGGVAQEEAA